MFSFTMMYADSSNMFLPSLSFKRNKVHLFFQYHKNLWINEYSFFLNLFNVYQMVYSNVIQEKKNALVEVDFLNLSDYT